MISFYRQIRFILQVLSITICILTNQLALSATDPMIDGVINTKVDHELDIVEMIFYPEIDGNGETPTIELFHGEIDDTESSELRLNWVKRLIDEERIQDPNLETQVNVVGNYQSRVRHSKEAQSFIAKLKYDEAKVKYEELPSSLSSETYTYYKNGVEKRKPTSAASSKTLWTLIRFTGIGTGTYVGLFYFEDVLATTAFMVSMMPAIVSGGLAKFNDHLGRFLNTHTWSTMFLESEKPFAKFLRKKLGIETESFIDYLINNKKRLLKEFPGLAQHKDLWNELAFDGAMETLESKKRFRAKVISILKGASTSEGLIYKLEKQFRYFITEVMYTAVAIKVPQLMAGIGDSGLFSAIGSTLSGSAWGTVAQGFFETAIHTRKFQMIEELQRDVISGVVKIADKDTLLKHIHMVLKEGSVIEDWMHPALGKISQIARKRATILSLVSVSAVSMKVAGIAAAGPILWGLTAGGVVYYTKVEGGFEKFAKTKYGQKVMSLYKSSKSTTKALPYYLQFCSRKYLKRN